MPSDRPPLDRAALGRFGEDLVAAKLSELGARLLGRNIRVRSTEFDVIAEDREGILFIEVKTRSSDRYGQPYEAVDRAKRQRMERGALEFMEREGMVDGNYRFVIASILVVDASAAPRLEWIEET